MIHLPILVTAHRMAPAGVPELLHLLNNSFSFSTSFSTFFSFFTSFNPYLSLLYFSRCQQVDKVGVSAVLTVPTPFNKFLSRANSPSMPSLLIASHPPQHTSFFSFSLSKYSELSSCLPTETESKSSVTELITQKIPLSV